MASQTLVPEPASESARTMEPLSMSQSLGLIEIFVNASLACICYSRELLPYHSRCFQSRFMSDLKALESNNNNYLTFRDLDAHLKPGHSQEFKFLVRSENDSSNSMLDLLEAGIFNSLERGYLEAVQFFITPDVQDPAAVLESYTFTFTYGRRARGKDIHVMRVEISSPANCLIVDALKSFRRAIKALLHSLRDMPRLPRKKSLGMSLVYNSSCPQDYQPSGFHDGRPISVKKDAADWSSLWSEPKMNFEELDTGLHQVAVGSSNVHALLAANGPTPPQEGDVDFNIQLQAMQKPSSPPSHLISTVPQRNQLQEMQKTFTKSSRPVLHLSQREPLAELDQVSNSQQSTQKLNAASSNGKLILTKTRRDIQTSSQNSNHSEASAYQGRSKKVVPTVSASLKNRRQRNLVPSKIAELVVHACAAENNNRGDYIFDPDGLKGNKILRLLPVMEVRCECQSTRQMEEMLVCHLCGTVQHRGCYGFSEIKANRCPEEHFCYACLLLPREEILNTQMPGRVRMRLALEYLFSQETPLVGIGTRFSEAVHLDISRAADLEIIEATVRRLLEEGFIKEASEQMYVVVKSKKVDAQSEYLDHLASIWDHYEATKDKETATVRYEVIRAAVDLYTAGRTYLVDEVDPVYDEMIVVDAFGQSVTRWGYYQDKLATKVTETGSLKRKASLETFVTLKKPLGRKLSVGGFINVDRLTPSTEASVDKAEQAVVDETFDELDWEQRLAGRNSETASAE